MSFYCPECGTEVTGGVKCPDCGHMDEECTNCGSLAGDDGWFCQECGEPRSYCPDCGHQLDETGCPECDALRPAVCESCGDVLERDATECGSCGYNPGTKLRSRARKTKYAGYGIAGLLFVYTLGTLGRQLVQGTLNSTVLIAAVSAGVIFPAIVLAPTLYLSRRWRRKSNERTVDTIPS